MDKACMGSTRKHSMGKQSMGNAFDAGIRRRHSMRMRLM
jgi:hypothetical protein